MVTFGLINWNVGVQVAKLRPAEGEHLDGGIQLHRAGTERDHGVCQGEIPSFQFLNVPHQLSFRMIAVKNILHHEIIIPTESRINTILSRYPGEWNKLFFSK